MRGRHVEGEGRGEVKVFWGGNRSDDFWEKEVRVGEEGVTVVTEGRER